LNNFYPSLWPVDTGYELIRIGGNKDGSYLLPNALDGIQLCLSPGTAGMIDFEVNLADIYGIPSLLCDPVHGSPINDHPLLQFDQIAIGSCDTDSTISIPTWMSRHGYQDASPLLLSMDIEGAEVNVINDMHIDLLGRVRIATIEFHYLHLLHNEPNSEYSIKLVNAVEKMKKYFDIVHFKPNNNCPFYVSSGEMAYSILYTCIELTFLNKQLRRKHPKLLPIHSLPHSLDIPNVMNKPNADYSTYVQALKN